MTHEITDEYAAGWIEARGRLQINAGSSSRPTIRVISVYPEIPDMLLEHFGGGDLDYFHPKSAPHMTLYVWQARGVLALDVLQRTAPHMVTELREEAERVLERQAQRVA